MMRPESRLAAGVVGLGLAVAMLVNVTLVSCEHVGGSSPAAGTAATNRTAPLLASADSTGDYRLSRVTAEPEMRVRLLAATDAVRIAPGSSVALSDVQGRPMGAPVVVKGAPAEVRIASSGWVLGPIGGGAQGGTKALGIDAGSALVLTGAGGVNINGAAYPGRVRLVARSDAGPAAFDVIEHLPMEDYLPGVVAKEMPSGWSVGAYQVQAVCARTYALHEKLRTAGNGQSTFDVESSDRDQVYSGATSNKAVIDAVRSTRGWVLADGEVVLRAYFSSTCGGRTASARDTWPTGRGFEFNLAGPIQAARRAYACEGSPLFRWSVTRDRAELVQRLRTYGERHGLLIRRIKDLWSIETLSTNADGRPNAYKIVEPGGVWYQLSGEQLRLALNQSVPPTAATAGSGGGGGVGGAPASAVQGYGTGGDAEADPTGAVPDVDRKTRVASSDIEVVGPKGRSTVTINGRGFGHGVGMCQFCAKAFAERGEDWQTCVLRFYPGARLVQLY